MKFPLPESADVVAAVPAPGSGTGFWAGSSSAALDEPAQKLVPDPGAGTATTASADSGSGNFIR